MFSTYCYRCWNITSESEYCIIVSHIRACAHTQTNREDGEIFETILFVCWKKKGKERKTNMWIVMIHLKRQTAFTYTFIRRFALFLSLPFLARHSRQRQIIQLCIWLVVSWTAVFPLCRVQPRTKYNEIYNQSSEPIAYEFGALLLLSRLKWYRK